MSVALPTTRKAVKAMPFRLKTKFEYDNDTELHLGFRDANTLCVVSMTSGRMLEEYYKQSQVAEMVLPSDHLFNLPYASVAQKVNESHRGIDPGYRVLGVMNHLHVDIFPEKIGQVVGQDVRLYSNLSDTRLWDDTIVSAELVFQ